MLGLNHSVRKTPLRSRTTKLHSAISPSMKDQWSGKTLRRFFLATVARPRRSSAQLATAPARLGFLAVAAVELVVATLLVSMLMTGYSGPGSFARAGLGVALPVAGSDGFEEVALGHQVAVVVDLSGSCGRARAAGPKTTLAASARSNVDWWQGQSRWWVFRSLREIGQPTWVQILE